MTDWQKLSAWMKQPHVQAAVARYEPQADDGEEPPEQGRLWEEE